MYKSLYFFHPYVGTGCASDIWVYITQATEEEGSERMSTVMHKKGNKVHVSANPISVYAYLEKSLAIQMKLKT